MLGFWYYLLMTLFVSGCIFMILLILIQKGRGGGLSGAFGGAGGNTAFGTKTGDVLTWATSIVFGVFLVLAVCLNKVTDTTGSKAAVIPPTPTYPAMPSVPSAMPPASAQQATPPSTQPSGAK